jgi:hypothetical protein
VGKAKRAHQTIFDIRNSGGGHGAKCAFAHPTIVTSLRGAQRRSNPAFTRGSWVASLLDRIIHATAAQAFEIGGDVHELDKMDHADWKTFFFDTIGVPARAGDDREVGLGRWLATGDDG